jgi:HD-like signal output (HDOD) protein
MLPVTPVLADHSADHATVTPSTSSSPLSAKQQAIVSEVLAALEADQLDLPVLPDIAFKVRKLHDDPDSSTSQFVQLVSTDLAISLYLIKAANSAALSLGHPVGNLYDAIPRLGYRMLYSMVMNITLTKMFQAKSQLIDQKLTELWVRSRVVAANSYVLAHKKQHLKPEDAMLAGLVHEIGALPLYLYADRNYPEIDAETLARLINCFSAPVGIRLLQCWNFPNELIDVVADQMGLRSIARSDVADFVDVVTMANLQMQETTKTVDWRNVSAAERLGFYAGDCKNFSSEHAEQLASVNGILGMGTA